MNDQSQLSQHVHPELRPSKKLILLHLEHLFGGDLDGKHEGMIELAWTTTKATKDGRYPVKFGMLFGTDQLDELADKALELNATPMCNVYVGAAPRRPDTKPGNPAAAGPMMHGR